MTCLFSNTLAIWVNRKLKLVLQNVIKLHHETPRVSTGYSSKSQAKHATQNLKGNQPYLYNWSKWRRHTRCSSSKFV